MHNMRNCISVVYLNIFKIITLKMKIGNFTSKFRHNNYNALITFNCVIKLLD